MIKKLFITFFVTVLLVAAGTGCRTAHGFGEDMETAGDKIQNKTD
jgi:predicted small secreted protein